MLNYSLVSCVFLSSERHKLRVDIRDAIINVIRMLNLIPFADMSDIGFLLFIVVIRTQWSFGYLLLKGNDKYNLRMDLCYIVSALYCVKIV